MSECRKIIEREKMNIACGEFIEVKRGDLRNWYMLDTVSSDMTFRELIQKLHMQSNEWWGL